MSERDENGARRQDARKIGNGAKGECVVGKCSDGALSGFEWY